MSDQPTEQHYIWHHELHEKWGNERLYFWRLAFFPTYNRGKITEAISEVMERNRVRSFALYETLGLYDLVMRIWLPVSTNFQDFENELREALDPQQLQVIDVFTVGSVVRHWPWLRSPSDTTMTRPAEALENGPLSDRDLDLGNSAARGLNPTVAKGFSARHLIAECGKHNGIKFIIVVTATAQLTTFRAREALRDGLLEILSDAGGKGISGSLYEGSGFGQFLIVGGVRHEGFGMITSEVIEPIIGTDLGRRYAARPYTYICAGVSNPIEFEDVLPIFRKAHSGAPTASKLLLGDESEKVEVKASASLNVDRWLRGDRRKEADDDVFTDGVVRAVVGLLNADGGEVVIGALELDKYGDCDLSGYPTIGKYACIGVEEEYGLGTADWDGYSLRLADKLNASVEPPPTGLISIMRDSVEDRSVAILTVRATIGPWFYIKGDPRLYVRDSGATKVVSGPAADAYRAARARF